MAIFQMKPRQLHALSKFFGRDPLCVLMATDYFVGCMSKTATRYVYMNVIFMISNVELTHTSWLSDGK